MGGTLCGSFLLGGHYPHTWHYCFPLRVSFPKGLRALQGHHRPESVTTVLEPACPQLEQLASCCLGLPRGFTNSSVEATCKILSIFHTSGSRKFWRVCVDGKQLESGVLVCTWQQDGKNLFSLLRLRRL